MAIALVQSFNANSGAVGVSTLAVTVTALTAGNTVFVAVGTDAACYLTVNSGTIDWSCKTFPGTSNTSGLLFRGRIITGGATTITVNLPATAAHASLAGFEVSNTNRLRDDVSSVPATATSTSAASNATPTTSNANELWVGAVAGRTAVTFSAAQIGGTNATNTYQDKTSVGTANDRSICVFYRIVTSTGTPTATATVSGSQVWGAICATYEETAAGGILINQGMEGGFQ